MTGWQEIRGRFTKEFAFTNFTEALTFANLVGKLAEERNHHPDILIHSYKKVRIMLFTHSENKISEKDRELARLIDAL